MMLFCPNHHPPSHQKHQTSPPHNELPKEAEVRRSFIVQAYHQLQTSLHHRSLMISLFHPSHHPPGHQKTSNGTPSRLPTKRHGSKKKVSLSLASISEESSSSQSNEVVIPVQPSPSQSPTSNEETLGINGIIRRIEGGEYDDERIRGIIQTPPLCPPTEWKFHPSGHQWYYTPLVRWNEKKRGHSLYQWLVIIT